MPRVTCAIIEHNNNKSELQDCDWAEADVPVVNEIMQLWS